MQTSYRKFSARTVDATTIRCMKKFLLLLVLPSAAIMLPSLVSADNSAAKQPTPSSSQISCMAEKGFTKPSVKPATPPTREQHEKMKAAARACGLAEKAGDSQGKTVKPKTGISTASQTPTVNSSSVAPRSR